jgi:hypothetical protein
MAGQQSGSNTGRQRTQTIAIRHAETQHRQPLEQYRQISERHVIPFGTKSTRAHDAASPGAHLGHKTGHKPEDQRLPTLATEGTGPVAI